MDINYILGREQQSISRAISSTSKSARAVHRTFAAAYGKLLEASGFPHRSQPRVEQEPHPGTTSLSAAVVDGWENEGGQLAPPSSEPAVAVDWGDGVDLLTRDRISLHVRPGLMSDENALIAFFREVGVEDLRFRFGGTSHAIGKRTVRPLLGSAISDCITLLAIGSDRTIVAASTLAGVANTTSAEVALSVHALWKGRGIGWSLLEHTIAYAGEHGFRQVTCFETGDDRLAINLEREMGFVARLISASPVELALIKDIALD
jgi:GNAT superfamily N-acetyltransferase